VRNLGVNGMAPASGARMFVHHKPAGIACCDAVEFPGRDGDEEDRSGACRWLPGGAQAGVRDAAHHAGADPILEEAGVPDGVVNVHSVRAAPARWSTPCLARSRCGWFPLPARETEVGRRLLHSAADQVLNTAMELGGNAPFIVFEDARHRCGDRRAMIAKNEHRMGEACSRGRFYVHEKVQDGVFKKLHAKMAGLKMGKWASTTAWRWAPGQRRRPRQGGRHVRRRGVDARGAREESSAHLGIERIRLSRAPTTLSRPSR